MAERTFKKVKSMGKPVYFMFDETKITEDMKANGIVCKTGEHVEGTLISKGSFTPEETKKINKFYVIKQEDNVLITLFDKGNMGSQIDLVIEGKFIRVTYQGKQPMKTPRFGQTHYNHFDVEVAE